MERTEKKYNYFYIINNLLNGHFYLGVHSTDDLDDGYFGSGKVLKQAIKKHGVENFELTILKYFDTRDDVLAFEKEVVNERFLEYYKGICYNLKKGGEGGFERTYTPDELKQRVRDAHKRYEMAHRDEISHRRRIKYHTSEKEKYAAYYQEHKEERRVYMKKYRAKKKAASIATI